MLGYEFDGCTGSIIDQQWILTACHCVARSFDRIGLNDPITYYPTEGYKIVAGADNWTHMANSREERIAQKFIAHPLCLKLQHDVAVVKIKPLPPFWTHARVQPVKFFNHNKNTALEEFRRLQRAHTMCIRLGYGLEVKEPRVKSPKVKVGDGWLLTDKECYEQVCKGRYDCKEQDFNNNGWFCVRSNSSHQCPGDSGGPVICNGFVWGVLSGGDKICTRGYYDVLQISTRIDNLLEMFHKKDESQN